MRKWFEFIANSPNNILTIITSDLVRGAMYTSYGLVLLIEFKDRKHSIKPDYFKDLLFSKGSNHSMRDFYLEASWNQLDINGEVNDEWYFAKRYCLIPELPF